VVAGGTPQDQPRAFPAIRNGDFFTLEKFNMPFTMWGMDGFIPSQGYPGFDWQLIVYCNGIIPLPPGPLPWIEQGGAESPTFLDTLSDMMNGKKFLGEEGIWLTGIPHPVHGQPLVLASGMCPRCGKYVRAIYKEDILGDITGGALNQPLTMFIRTKNPGGDTGISGFPDDYWSLYFFPPRFWSGS
jgi:hypothetical protein